MSAPRHEAVLYDRLGDQYVQCRLCNFNCRIAPDSLGLCRVRQNIGGTLYSLTYHALCSANSDPIEKKPLFHFQPGQRSFSIATPGCNFQCDFCQNWQISQAPRQGHINGEAATAQRIVAAALEARCQSIAYTYTEPTIFMELAADTGRLARARGLANVFVSNGYMTIEALQFAADFLDAINVDLKAFTEEFYRDHCKARLAPVLETLKYIARETDMWLEVTTLVIPGRNDSEKEIGQIASFIAAELGPHVPWHISRFHPQYQHSDGTATPATTLKRAYELGKAAGLHYVYVGNLPGSGGESTHCHHCNHLLIERIGYRLGQYNLKDGKCPECDTALAGKYLAQ